MRSAIGPTSFMDITAFIIDRGALIVETTSDAASSTQ
jgi:hypothetical protein